MFYYISRRNGAHQQTVTLFDNKEDFINTCNKCDNGYPEQITETGYDILADMFGFDSLDELRAIADEPDHEDAHLVKIYLPLLEKHGVETTYYTVRNSEDFEAHTPEPHDMLQALGRAFDDRGEEYRFIESDEEFLSDLREGSLGSLTKKSLQEVLSALVEKEILTSDEALGITHPKHLELKNALIHLTDFLESQPKNTCVDIDGVIFYIEDNQLIYKKAHVKGDLNTKEVGFCEYTYDWREKRVWLDPDFEEMLSLLDSLTLFVTNESV